MNGLFECLKADRSGSYSSIEIVILYQPYYSVRRQPIGIFDRTQILHSLRNWNLNWILESEITSYSCYFCLYRFSASLLFSFNLFIAIIHFLVVFIRWNHCVVNCRSIRILIVLVKFLFSLFLFRVFGVSFSSSYLGFWAGCWILDSSKLLSLEWSSSAFCFFHLRPNFSLYSLLNLFSCL